ncbi:hypothetical protein FQN60_005744 [Etheostoma spectabile]|uniref:Sema domain-containing protein n=1 Tax=Etheostoma spectabile TaxID=54343 RepID=A0A5J5CI35_9PERO|nr:hypothetical protein FQN60_005744 [Etheostoma spectabile]
MGGHRSLVNKWTTFLKARLMCSVPGVNGIDTHFDELHMGTVLKVVTIPRESWHDLEEVVLEEMTVFREPTPITAMELSTKQQQLYLGSGLGVSQMSLHRCEVYGKACAECCLARDPYCAWDGSECSRYFPTAKRRTRRQDIRNGDPLSQCSDLQHHDDTDGLGGSVEDRSVYGVENSSMFLECSPKSQRALIYWQLQKPNDDRKLEGLLIRSLAQSDTGIYHCQAVEHGFIQPLLRLNLQVIPAQKLGDILPGLSSVGGGVGQSPKHRLWYRDFLSLLDHPDLNSVEEFCDRVWKKERKQKRGKTPNGNSQGKTDSTGGSNPALRPKALAPNAQKQQASPPQSRPWPQAGAPTVEGPARSQTTQKSQPNLGTLTGQAPNNNQKTQNVQKGQGSLAGSQAAGGSRASSQHAAKWRRMQENKKGRNRRTHELQRPPRSV